MGHDKDCLHVYGNHVGFSCSENRERQRSRIPETAEHTVIVQPVTDNFSRFKPLGWYLPGEAQVHILPDSTIRYEGTVHWFESEEAK